MVMREMRVAVISTLCLWIVTGVIYPALFWGLGFIFGVQANGSLVDAQGRLTTDPQQAIGSLLIGQPFSEVKYFWGRPSSVSYSAVQESTADALGILKTGLSGASNLAPSNPALLERIQSEMQVFSGSPIPGDLIYSSGSGLDPHVSRAAAFIQVERVAQARNVTPQEIEALIPSALDPRFLGIFGEAGVNVLRLNLKLDEEFPVS